MRLDFRAMMAGWTGVKLVTAAATLNACDVVVDATPPGSASYDVTMPKLGDAFWYPYMITTTANDAGTVVVKSAEGATLGTFTAAGDQLVMVPGLTAWILLHDTTT